NGSSRTTSLPCSHPLPPARTVPLDRSGRRDQTFSMQPFASFSHRVFGFGAIIVFALSLHGVALGMGRAGGGFAGGHVGGRGFGGGHVGGFGGPAAGHFGAGHFGGRGFGGGNFSGRFGNRSFGHFAGGFRHFPHHG